MDTQGTDTSGLLDGLNPGQQAAVLHSDGPGLVLAGAGSGKTETMVRRVARLLKEGEFPDSILLTTFTNRAAREMRERLAGWVGEEAAEGVVAGTLHSIVWREIINAPMAALDLRVDERLGELAIIDEKESTRRVGEAIRALPPDMAALWVEAKCTPAELMRTMTVQRAAGVWAPEYMAWAKANGSDAEVAEAAAWCGYEDLLRLYGEVDFDGVLLWGNRFLKSDAEFLSECRQRWRHVLVDEFQDINPVQWTILNQIAEDRFFGVGDERQSIYRFRGADVGVLLNVQKTHPNITLLEMSGNYRSCPPVLDAANACASAMQDRLGREDLVALGRRPEGLPQRQPTAVQVPDAECEAEWVVAGVKRDLLAGESDIAVLYRSRAARQAVERALILADVPHRIVGDLGARLRVEAKDAVALLGFLHRDWDASSTKRLLRATAFGLSESALDKALKGGMGVVDFLNDRANARTVKGEATRLSEKVAGVLALRKAFQGLIEAEASPGEVREAAQRAWEVLMLRGVSRRGGPVEPAHLTFDLYEQHLREGLDGSEAVDALQLVSDPKGAEEEESPVQLMTIHAAKGQEFDAVYLVGEHGPAPGASEMSHADREEERRIFYVAVTRARRLLTVFSPDAVVLHGRRHESLGRSPWVDEIVEAGGLKPVTLEGPPPKPSCASSRGMEAGL